MIKANHYTMLPPIEHTAWSLTQLGLWVLLQSMCQSAGCTHLWIWNWSCIAIHPVVVFITSDGQPTNMSFW